MARHWGEKVESNFCGFASMLRRGIADKIKHGMGNILSVFSPTFLSGIQLNDEAPQKLQCLVAYVCQLCTFR